MMKANRYSRYARTILFTMTGMLLLGGCAKEFVEGADKPLPDGSVTLNISLPAPVSKEMTRAVPDEYDTIGDLNIIIATGNAGDDVITYIFYLNEMSQAAIEALFPQGGVTYTSSGGGHGIHFTKEWAEYYEISSEDCAFFLVSNWGNPIGLDTDRIGVGDTVEQLRAVRVERRDYVMFGESVDITGTPGDGHTTQAGHEEGRSLKIELERMVAMITVAIDGTDLDPNVQIIPVSISLHNVPSWGTLGVNNVLTRQDRITPQAGAISAGREAGVSDWGVLSRGGTAGGHYAADNWNDAAVKPLILYENYHGDDFGQNIPESQQAYKRPSSSIPGVSYSATPTREQIAAVTGACSYLQFEARYRNTSTGQSGSVTYRLFLGGDTYKDFNVMRNTYYRITLDLDNTAISEGSYSWRVNSNLGTVEISDSDFILNGGGEVIVIDVTNGNTPSAVKIEYQGNNQSQANAGRGAWIYVYSQNRWEVLDDIQNDNFPLTAGDQLLLYVAPMIRDITWFGEGPKREVTFRLRTANGSTYIPWITITQHEPIRVTVDGNSPEPVRAFAENELGWTLPRTFYIDRVDHDTAPWGFDDWPILGNQPSGLENGNALMVQNRYLPYGAGSAMMHAAYMRYYQRAPPVTPNMADPTNFVQVLAHNPPAGYPRDFFIPSVKEWRLIDMLFEAGVQVEDPAVSPIIWNDYWTSDAVTDPNSRESHTYRMGHPEDAESDAAPRSSSVSYRMLYFQP